MRDGYLAALAARTLGVTPLLRPVTPSRFEDMRAEAPGDIFEVSEIADAQSPAQADPRRPPAPSVSAPAVDDDQPLLPRPAARTAEPPARAAFVEHDEVAQPDRVDERRDDAIDRPRPAGDPTAAAPHPAASGWGPTAIDALVRAVTAPDPPPGDPAAKPARAAPTDGSESAVTRADVRAADRPVAAAPEPAVIVHIGRIEVRAVEAPRRPVVIAPPAGAAAPSLSDYLLARERGGRR